MIQSQKNIVYCDVREIPDLLLYQKIPLTLYHTMPSFNNPAKEALTKHGKKEKMLVTSESAFNLDQSKTWSFGKELNHYHTMPHFEALKIYKVAVENFSNSNKQFLLFSQCLQPYMVFIFHLKCSLKCCLQFVSIWTSLKFCHLVMG